VATNRIDLKNRAEAWDANSRTSADHLTLDQQSGDFLARGRVASVYHEKAASAAGDAAATKARDSGDLFSTAEPVYATAERMASNQRSGLLEYHGKARLWQGADRIEAEEIRIERRQKKLTARGNVVSVIGRKDSPQEGASRTMSGAEGGKPIEVRADSMQYEEAARRVEYDGRVELKRGALLVQSRELDAWLAPPGDTANRLEKAAAHGEVKVLEAAAAGAAGRRGFGKRAEYYPGEERVVLEGDPARVVNPRQDTTQGSKLTYFLNDDRLLVLGSPQQRSYSLRRQRQD
jgi:lipopolysaccharide transport protein LptA